MSLTAAFQALDDVGRARSARAPLPAEVCDRLRRISRADLAAWLQEEVANPPAERYLLTLFFEGGAADGNPRACVRFSRELALRRRSKLERRVLGWGEISQVAEVSGLAVTAWCHPGSGASMPMVYKKMPPFLRRAEAEAFVERYLEYNTVLRDQVGIQVPAFTARIVGREPAHITVFVIQERVDPASVGHEILRSADLQAAKCLWGLILQEYEKLYRFNQSKAAEGYRLGLDGQIPNWSVSGYAGSPGSVTRESRLLYLDTNVPMIRVNGQDVVSTDMYFQALPGLARSIIKRLKIDQEVMDRYFQLRVIVLDFLGNLIVRHRADLVPPLAEMANNALAGPFADAHFEPFTLEEVQKYYRSDVATWRLWRSLKLVGALSDGLSNRQWDVLRRVPEFYRIWTRPIF